MTSSTIKSANANGAMHFWSGALCIAYAMVLLQTYHLAGGLLHDPRLASLAARPGMSPVVEKFSGLKLSLSDKPLSPDQRNITVASIIAAIFLIGYLHLKLSVSAGDRNRLAALKGRAETELDKMNFDTSQKEHEQIGKLLVAASALSEEELAQALDLSKAAHRLLGECFISFNWISASGLTEALEISRSKPAAGKSEAAQEQLRTLRLTEEQIAAKIAQQQEAPTAVSLAKSDYKVLLARSIEKKAAKARAALEQSLIESDSPTAAQPESDSSGLVQPLCQPTTNNLCAAERTLTVIMPAEQRNHPILSQNTGTPIARSIDVHMQNEETRALLQRMNEADQLYALFRSEPQAAPKASFASTAPFAKRIVALELADATAPAETSVASQNSPSSSKSKKRQAKAL